MRSNNLITTLAFIFITVSLQAQSNIDWKKENFPGRESEFDKAFKTYEEGNKMYYEGGPPLYEAALAKYLDAYQFNPDNDYLNFHLGHIYYALHHPHDAEKYYEKAIKLNPSLRDQILYELATAYHQDGDWDGAISHYNEYKTFLKQGGHKHLNMHSKDVAHELRWVDLCIKQCETGKVISHDTVPIIFENISPAINSKYPEYSAVVNHNEDLLVFVSRRPGNKGNSDNHGSAFEFEDVYTSRRDANGWSKAEHLHGDVNSQAHEAPVWLSSDGTRLLLYYNKSKSKDPKKQGDIYESDFVDGKWTDPSPVKGINSSWRETHASMSADGKTIYFTTNNPKWAKHGGLDIVKTTYNDAEGKWNEPVDIGSKINTEWDEESPFIKPDGKTFYFSSQGHTSVGGFDFFRCELSENGTFSEPINMGIPLNTPFDDAFIYFSDDGKRVYFNSNRDGGFGSQDIYEGFILTAISFPVEVVMIDAETNDSIRDGVVTIKKVSNDSIWNLTNTNGVHTTEVGIMKNFEVKVTAEGYNDEEFTFSTKYDQLVNFDTIIVKRTFLLKKDYSPIAFNGQLFDKVSGKPVDGIIEITKANSNDKVGQVQTVNTMYTIDLPRNKEYTITALAKGHMPYRETFKLTAKNNKKDLYLDRIKVGDRFAMRNVQYESGKATLKKESITELQILKDFMTENPYIKVEVSAHTDIIGSHAMNMKLSVARAKSIYDWLTKNGISKERITYKGYGPDLPIATNDTPEGRQLNRRSEIKILEE